MKTKAQLQKEATRDLRGRVNRALSDVQRAIDGFEQIRVLAEQARVAAERAKGELQAVIYQESHEIRVSLDKTTENRSDGQRRRRRRQATISK